MVEAPSPATRQENGYYEERNCDQERGTSNQGNLNDGHESSATAESDPRRRHNGMPIPPNENENVEGMPVIPNAVPENVVPHEEEEEDNYEEPTMQEAVLAEVGRALENILIRPGSTDRAGTTRRAANIMYSYVTIVVIVSFVALCGFIYLCVASYILDCSNVYITKFTLPKMHVQFDMYNDTISLHGKINHLVTFKRTGNSKAIPDSAFYTLSTGTIEKHTLAAVSSSKFQLSKNLQLMTVNFEAKQSGIEEQVMKDFQKRLREGKIWIRLQVDYKWLARVLLFPYNYRHAYVTCKTRYSFLIMEKQCSKNVPFEDLNKY